jgi:hypothetical protein
MRSISTQVCVLPNHIPNPPSVNPCSQVTHILGPFALDAHSLCSRLCTDLAQHFFQLLRQVVQSSSADGEWSR